MGKLNFKNKTFFFHTHQHEEKILAKLSGFKFDSEGRVWWSTHPKRAIKLRKFADLETEKYFKKLLIKTMPLPERLVYPKHLKPRKYQLSGAIHILTTNPSALGDDAGLGKTITAIIALNSDFGRCLVLCPPSLKYNWERELKKWCVHKAAISVIEGKSEFDNYNADIVIVPDSIIGRDDVRTALSLQIFRWLFIDEAHRFANWETERTKALYGSNNPLDDESKFLPVIDLADRVHPMSGTFMPNRPKELFPMFTALAPEVINFMGWHEYAMKFCEGYQTRHGVEGNGASNLDELKEIRKKFILRRRKKDVLTELPPKTRQIIFLDRASKKVEAYAKEQLGEIDIDDLVGDDNPLGDMATLRRLAGEDIVKPAANFVREQLEGSDEKIVVFTWHKSVLKELGELLREYSPLLMPGGLDNKRKDEIVQKFQADSKKRLIILNLEAGGVGHTLTAASRVIFAEYSWVPGKNEQGEDRIHRMGQKENCFAQYLVAKGSFSEHMLNRVFEKEENVETVMNN